MKKLFPHIPGPAILAAFLLILGSCTTLSVTVPPGMFVSTGDYVPGIKTLGVVQEAATVFAPLFIIDMNQVNQKLYEALIRKAQAAGADGLTNIHFSWKPSPLMYFTLTFASGVFDFTIEGIAIKR